LRDLPALINEVRDIIGALPALKSRGSSLSLNWASQIGWVRRLYVSTKPSGCELSCCFFRLSVAFYCDVGLYSPIATTEEDLKLPAPKRLARVRTR
jgi:hypothetical protein